MSAPPDVPELVARALRMSLQQGYLHATRTETGRLLATLAATRTGTIAECGTGCGVGAAWLRSGAPDGTRVITVESEAALAHTAMDMFTGQAVEVIHADWRTLSSWAPFSLVFLDAGAAKQAPRSEVIDWLEPGGLVVLDDFVPSSQWPPFSDGRVDEVRRDWLSDPHFTAVDVMVAPDTAVVVAVRR